MTPRAPPSRVRRVRHARGRARARGCSVLTKAVVVAAVVMAAVPARAQDPIMGHCKMCLLVLETLRSGYPFSLPTICQDNLGMEKNAADFSICQEVVAVLSQYGPSVALWTQQGCFRTEEYGAVEKLTPCPAHIVCSQMETLDAFVLTSTDLGSDPAYDHNKLGPRLIRPVGGQTQRQTNLIRTFCPQPKPQYDDAWLRGYSAKPCGKGKDGAYPCHDRAPVAWQQ